jgi:hypothetical protein
MTSTWETHIVSGGVYSVKPYSIRIGDAPPIDSWAQLNKLDDLPVAPNAEIR